MSYSFPSLIPDDIVTIPPVIVSPFTLAEVQAEPYHLAQRNMSALQPVSGAGKGVKVGVIDTGIDADHPEVSGRLVKATDLTRSRSGSNDRAGHGTHVASSIVGAKTGGAPQASLYVYKALGDEGWGQSSWIANAVDKAIEDGVHIINMSLGSPSPSRVIYDSLKRAYAAGIIVCAATGNDSSRRNSYPADFNDVCMAVAAIDRNRRRASFSNAGQGTDVCDYGVQVLGAKIGGGFVAMSGTSMATPVCASMHANRLSFEMRYGIAYEGPDAWYSKIVGFCDDLGAVGRDGSYGFGQINALKAFGTPPSKPDQPVPPTPDPKDPTPSPDTPVDDENELLGALYRTPSGNLCFVNTKKQSIVL